MIVLLELLISVFCHTAWFASLFLGHKVFHIQDLWVFQLEPEIYIYIFYHVIIISITTPDEKETHTHTTHTQRLQKRCLSRIKNKCKFSLLLLATKINTETNDHLSIHYMINMEVALQTNCHNLMFKFLKHT